MARHFGGGALHLEDFRLFHLGIDALLNACHDGRPGRNVGIHRAIVSCPVGVLSEEAQPSRHK